MGRDALGLSALRAVRALWIKAKELFQKAKDGAELKYANVACG
jgi:hypothetical protein